jgi:predicted HD phosphohydrolase
LDRFAKLGVHNGNQDDIITGAALHDFGVWVDANSNTKWMKAKSRLWLMLELTA